MWITLRHEVAWAENSPPAEPPQEIQRLHVDGYINDLAWNADGSRLAAGITDTKNHCRVWEAKSWKLLSDFDCTTYAGKKIAFHPDGSVMTPGGFYIDSSALNPADIREISGITKWNGDMGKPTLNLPSYSENDVFAASPDGAWVVGISSKGPTIYDGRSGAVLRTLKIPSSERHLDGAVSIAISPNGRELAVGTRSAMIHYFRISDGVLLRSFAAYAGDHEYRCEDLSYSPDGQFIATAKHKWGFPDNYIVAMIWRVGDGKLMWALPGSTWGDHDGAVAGRAVAWSPSGGVLAVGDDLALRIWRISDGAPELLLKRDVKQSNEYNKQGVVSVSYSPQGLLAVTEDNAIVIYR
jgi:WD40 repeat protein